MAGFIICSALQRKTSFKGIEETSQTTTPQILNKKETNPFVVFLLSLMSVEELWAFICDCILLTLLCYHHFTFIFI